MKKNIYSIILIEEIVKSIDEIAYSKNTNRSGLINQILADYLMFTTPEDNFRKIFEEIVKQVNEKIQIQPQRSVNTLAMKTVVFYKYNPTIKYFVEINLKDLQYSAEFRVSSRSQNSLLLLRLNGFFEFWIELESGHHENIIHDERNARFTRRFTNIVNHQNFAYRIGEYINTFDESLKLYFIGDNEKIKILYKNKME